MWKVITVAQTSEMLLKKLALIAEALTRHCEHQDRANGLMDGKAGIGLFFFYYARLTGQEKYADQGAELFTGIFQEIEEGFNDFRFSSGLAGIAWTLHHLLEHNFIQLEIEELLNDLDPFFHRVMTEQFQEKKYYDFLHGALGTGIYWLHRLPHQDVLHYLNSCIDQLDSIWQTVFDPNANAKGVNLGAAHGITSIIAFLSRAQNRGVGHAKIPRLLDRAVHYLMAQTLDKTQFNSVFPYTVQVDKPPVSSRLAWCYGDLGIGAVLWQAAQAAKNTLWEEKAIQILIDTTARKALQENLVMDACFCHGSAGIAHIYNRMYNETGLEIFKETTQYWLHQTLNMAVHEEGAAGFKMWCGKEIWQNSYGLLDGIAGIGLVLIAAVSDIEPNWDNCLLLGNQ